MRYSVNDMKYYGNDSIATLNQCWIYGRREHRK